MYAQADLSFCWLHLPHCWQSQVTAQFILNSGTPNLCDVSNGGCSDVCTMVDKTKVQCECNDTNQVLGNRDKMCIPANHSCKADEFVCKTGACLK